MTEKKMKSKKEMYDKAFDDGYKEGYKKGYDAGYDNGSDEGFDAFHDPDWIGLDLARNEAARNAILKFGKKEDIDLLDDEIPTAEEFIKKFKKAYDEKYKEQYEQYVNLLKLPPEERMKQYKS